MAMQHASVFSERATIQEWAALPYTPNVYRCTLAYLLGACVHCFETRQECSCTVFEPAANPWIGTKRNNAQSQEEESREDASNKVDIRRLIEQLPPAMELKGADSLIPDPQIIDKERELNRKTEKRKQQRKIVKEKAKKWAALEEQFKQPTAQVNESATGENLDQAAQSQEWEEIQEEWEAPNKEAMEAEFAEKDGNRGPDEPDVHSTWSDEVKPVQELAKAKWPNKEPQVPSSMEKVDAWQRNENGPARQGFFRGAPSRPWNRQTARRPYPQEEENLRYPWDRPDQRRTWRAYPPPRRDRGYNPWDDWGQRTGYDANWIR